LTIRYNTPTLLCLRSQGCSISARETVKIPPFSQNPRRPANIPLHTLSSSSRPYNRVSPSPVDSSEEKHGSSRSSISGDSDFSDTGDLVDQLANEEDPLTIQLRPSLEEELPRASSKHSGGRQKKRVRIHPDAKENEKSGAVKRKEDIPIPSPPPGKLSFGERLLVLAMAPNDGPSRIHGLHGKKLMYVLMDGLT
jgi:hypothetical protein